MMSRPIFTIIRLVTTIIMRLTGLNGNITRTIVSNIFLLSGTIYQRYGFLTTIQSISAIFSFLRNSRPITSAILSRRFINNHVDLKTLFMNYIVPYWDTMIAHKYRLIFVLFTSTLTTIVAVIRPIWFIRFTFGIILSSLGILWHETLSTFTYLKKGAIYVISLLDGYGFNIPLPSLKEVIDSDNYVNSSIYAVIGVMLLGTLGIAISIICLEYYIPPINIPTPISYSERLMNYFYLNDFLTLIGNINYNLHYSHPKLYNYFLIPFNNYIIYPIWHYTVALPFNFSYDYLFHPTADAIRYIYDILFNYYSTSPPKDPSVGSNSERDISIIDNRTDKMSRSSSGSSTETITASNMNRTPSNGTWIRTPSSLGLGNPGSLGQGSNIKLDDMSDVTDNPFNPFN